EPTSAGADAVVTDVAAEPHAALALMSGPAPDRTGPAAPLARAAGAPAIPPGTFSPRGASVGFGLAGWLVGLGALGTALGLGRLVAGWWRLRSFASRLEWGIAGPLHELLARLTAELGIRRTVRLARAAHRVIPMTWGYWRPVVVVPAEAASWSPERCRMVLTHELGHVLRWDCLTHLLGHAAQALYWFHPLAWSALARQQAEQEQACDNLVLAWGAEAHDYAEQLLSLTAGLPAPALAAPVALGMARSSNLRHRLRALLDPARDHRPLRRRGQAAV